MNWDEQLIEDCTEDDGRVHPHTDHVIAGAHWMRHQLRTPEAIERVARALARLDPEEEWPDETIIDDEYRIECHEIAREVITALLGDDR